MATNDRTESTSEGAARTAERRRTPRDPDFDTWIRIRSRLREAADGGTPLTPGEACVAAVLIDQLVHLDTWKLRAERAENVLALEDRVFREEGLRAVGHLRGWVRKGVKGKDWHDRIDLLHKWALLRQVPAYKGVPLNPVRPVKELVQDLAKEINSAGCGSYAACVKMLHRVRDELEEALEQDDTPKEWIRLNLELLQDIPSNPNGRTSGQTARD